MARTASGTWNWRPIASEIFLEAFSRIGMFAPALQQLHMIECRRSANLIAQTDFSNRGYDLWQVGDELLCIPLQPGQSPYPVPYNVIDIADAYLRTYTPGSTTVALGNALVPLGPQGNPLVGTPFGDPMLIQPSSGTLSCEIGSQEIAMNWPAHGQIPGNPIFWNVPASIGGMALYNFSIVDQVLDSDTLTFLAPAPALETQIGQGAPRLFSTNVGNALIGCIFPDHGLSPGDTFLIPIELQIGGFTLSGAYTVYSVQSPYEFSFTTLPPATPALLTSDSGSILTGGGGLELTADISGAPVATSTASAFENSGQLSVSLQSPGIQPTDIYLYPLGRTEYAQLPDKNVQGRPTQYWFNRTNPPQIVMWPVPPAVTAGQPPYFGFCAYRMRSMQDINPIGGQLLDMPPRAVEAFRALLTAAMAEKFKAAAFTEKATIAEQKFAQFADEDREKVTMITNFDFGGYFR